MHERGWWEKSPHIVIENMDLSTINFGKCESQHAWKKKEIQMGREGQFLQLIRREEKCVECWEIARQP
jgi:hypothetical protein